MTWLQLRLDSHRDSAEPIQDWLLDHGASAVTLEDNADQPLLEPGVGETPLWNEIRITGLYPADTETDALLNALPDAWRSQCHPRVEILEDKDWEREWMQHYQPLCVGERLWVCPSWLEPPEPEAVNLRLDPGLAFGTGTHPTTELCLRQLDGMNVEDQRIVDYGCGSGILAIATLLLGAKRALGVDNDPQALVASRNNAALNGLDDDTLTTTLPGDKLITHWHSQADVVIANILAGPLMSLSPILLELLRPKGTLLLAGLLQNQAEALCEHYRQAGVTLSPVAEKEGWVCLRGQLDHSPSSNNAS